MKIIATLVLCTLTATFAYAAGSSKPEGDFANEATETMDAAASAPTEKPAEKKSEKKAEAKADASAKEAAPTTQPEAATSKTDAKPQGKYEGLYTFDWKRLTKCQFIGPVVNAMLTDPKTICKKSEKGTGGPITCKVDEKREYLIFKTKEDCRVEYDEQLKASP